MTEMLSNGKYMVYKNVLNFNSRTRFLYYVINSAGSIKTLHLGHINIQYINGLLKNCKIAFSLDSKTKAIILKGGIFLP